MGKYIFNIFLYHMQKTVCLEGKAFTSSLNPVSGIGRFHKQHADQAVQDEKS